MKHKDLISLRRAVVAAIALPALLAALISACSSTKATGRSTGSTSTSAAGASSDRAQTYLAALRPDVQAAAQQVSALPAALQRADADFQNHQGDPASDLSGAIPVFETLVSELDSLSPPDNFVAAAAEMRASAQGLVRCLQDQQQAYITDSGALLTQATAEFTTNTPKLGAAIKAMYGSGGLGAPTRPSPVSSAPVAAASTVPPAASAAGCTDGPTTASSVINGYGYRLVHVDQYSYELCVTTPGGTTSHLASDTSTATPFGGSTYFKADGLGHVFLDWEVGQTASTVVVLPGSDVQYLTTRRGWLRPDLHRRRVRQARSTAGPRRLAC